MNQEERLKKFKKLNDWKVYYENLYRKTKDKVKKEVYKNKSLEFVNRMCKVFGNRFDSNLNPKEWLDERKKFEEELYLNLKEDEDLEERKAFIRNMRVKKNNYWAQRLGHRQ